MHILLDRVVTSAGRGNAACTPEPDPFASSADRIVGGIAVAPAYHVLGLLTGLLRIVQSTHQTWKNAEITVDDRCVGAAVDLALVSLVKHRGLVGRGCPHLYIAEVVGSAPFARRART